MSKPTSETDTGMNRSPALKRLLDIILASSALLLAAPAIMTIASAIRLTMGAPVLFRQLRPGYRGKPFQIVKFRTMRDSRDADGHPLPDTMRMTPLGDLLRRTGLDELPELWNVLRGEMSIVGPRPLLMEYLERYSTEQARRHDVRPGITGWAAVHGRRSTEMPERLQLDVWYVDHWSILLDIRIMARTLAVMLRGTGSRTHDPSPSDAAAWGLEVVEVSDDSRPPNEFPR